MRLLIFISLTLFAFNGIAEEECDETSPMPKAANALLKVASSVNCPNASKLKNLCAKVGTKEEDADPNSMFLYSYQRIVNEAACANPEKESDSVVREKIQKMWNKFDVELLCDSPKFNVAKGNVIKFAAYNLLTDFIVDATQIWKINLNKIDKSDNRTVLDYVKDEMAKSKGTPVGDQLKNYYDTLKKAGAKHKAEL